MGKEVLRKVKKFLFDATIIFKRDKPRITIAFSREQGILKPKDICIEGQVVDICDLRKIMMIGGDTPAISHPSKWLELMSVNGYVRTRLVVTRKENETCILVSKPMEKEV